MEELKALVHKLENECGEKEQIKILQEIGDKLLTEYSIVIGNEKIEPLRVEAYYYPYNDAQKFFDPSVHPSSVKINNFGRLYFIEPRYGYPGVDLCLSLGDYYLSYLIKNSRIGDTLFKQTALYDKYQQQWYEIQKMDVIHREPNNNKVVFHTSRVGLTEARTKFAHESLASMIDINTKDFYDYERNYGKEWTFEAYLNEHKVDDIPAFCREHLGYCPRRQK